MERFEPINEPMEWYSFIRSFIKEDDSWFIDIEKQEWEKKNTITFRNWKKKKWKEIRRRFDKLNIIINVSFLHSLLIAKRGGCGLIELAQCLRRGVAEQDMPFVCTASAVWRILYEWWNFVFSRMRRDGVVPWTTKRGVRGKDDFFQSEIRKKSFQLDRRQKIWRQMEWSKSKKGLIRNRFQRKCKIFLSKLSLKERVLTVVKMKDERSKRKDGKKIEFERDFH